MIFSYTVLFKFYYGDENQIDNDNATKTEENILTIENYSNETNSTANLTIRNKSLLNVIPKLIKMSSSEIILFVWIVTILVDEVQQVISRTANFFNSCFYVFIKSECKILIYSFGTDLRNLLRDLKTLFIDFSG